MEKTADEFFVEWLLEDYQSNEEEFYAKYELSVNTNDLTNTIINQVEEDGIESPYLRTNLYSRVIKKEMDRSKQHANKSDLSVSTKKSKKGYYVWLATEFYMANESDIKKELVGISSLVDFMDLLTLEGIEIYLCDKTMLDNPLNDAVSLANEAKEKKYEYA